MSRGTTQYAQHFPQSYAHARRLGMDHVLTFDEFEAAQMALTGEAVRGHTAMDEWYSGEEESGGGVGKKLGKTQLLRLPPAVALDGFRRYEPTLVYEVSPQEMEQHKKSNDTVQGQNNTDNHTPPLPYHYDNYYSSFPYAESFVRTEKDPGMAEQDIEDYGVVLSKETLELIAQQRREEAQRAKEAAAQRRNVFGTIVDISTGLTHPAHFSAALLSRGHAGHPGVIRRNAPPKDVSEALGGMKDVLRETLPRKSEETEILKPMSEHPAYIGLFALPYEYYAYKTSKYNTSAMPL